MRVLVIGAGGHGQVVADILLSASRHGSSMQVAGYLDQDRRLWNRRLLDLVVLGPVDDRDRFDHDAVIIGIGDNLTRRYLFERLSASGERFVTARHPRAILAASSVVGDGSVIGAGVLVNAGASVGSNVILNTGCIVEHHCRIDDHVHVAPGVQLGGQVTVGEGALIGIGATILPGRRVGAWSVVGAGAVVTAHVPPGAVVAGVPARPTKRRRRGTRSSRVRSLPVHH
jgi:sugar O-acyltransferase (sialic acid O-acetyltransferase NeuD family)